MGNAPCNHVGAVCIIGNFWNCSECDTAASRQYRKQAKVTPFPKSYEITGKIRESEPSIADIEIRVHCGGDPVDLTGAEVTFTPVNITDKFDEDFFVPTRGDMDIKVDDKGNVLTTSALEDIAYFQKKLFEALRVPKEYLKK